MNNYNQDQNNNNYTQPNNQPYEQSYNQPYNQYGFPSQPQPQAIPQQVNVVMMPETSGMAVASMVIGILGLLGLHFCGAFLVGIPLGHLALNKIKYSNGRVRGRGMAIAGLVMNYIPAIGIGLMMLFSLLFNGFMTK